MTSQTHNSSTMNTASVWTHLPGRRISSFHFFGGLGIALGFVLVISLASLRQLSIPVVLGLSASLLAAFFGMALATKVITGVERLVHYRYLIVALLAAALFLALLKQPLLPYLDLAVLGCGAFIALGRLGCLKAGCCHGRPHRWGIRYSEQHTEDELRTCYSGTPLLPVQLFESIFVAVTVLIGVILVFNLPAGAALAWYFLGYGTGRFLMEFLRGDADRAFFAGLSEAQWFSLASNSLLSAAILAGWLPFFTWQAGGTAVLWLSAFLLAAALRLASPSNLLAMPPRDLQTLLRLIRQPAQVFDLDGEANIAIHQLSTGLQLSKSITNGRTGWLEHYTLSYRAGRMPAKAAQDLAGLLVRTQDGPGSVTLVSSSQAVHHLFLPVAAASAGEAAVEGDLEHRDLYGRRARDWGKGYANRGY